MPPSRHETFRPIGQVLATEVLPALYRAQKLPLRISCIGTASYEADDDAERFDRTVLLGMRQFPDEAMGLAIQSVTRGDIHTGSYDTLRFRPRIILIQDGEYGLVLAGEIRAGIILWQQPVTSDTEARRIVTEASRLRGMALSASDPSEARDLRYRAAFLETRLVDSFWRETAAELLRLPQAA